MPIQHSRYGWLVVGAATGLTFLFGIFLSFGVFLDPLIKEFGWSSALTSFVFSVYCASYSFSTILAGRFADRYGSRITIGVGGLLTTLALLLSSRADAVWQLYITFGVIGGIGAATFWIPPTIAVMEYFSSSKNLNLAVSIVTTGTGVGVLLISPLAGYFIVDYGWRTCYVLFGVISGIICTFATIIVKNPRKTVDGRSEREANLRGPGLSGAMKTRNFWSLFGLYILGSGIARQTVVVYLVVFLIAAGLPLQAGAVCVGLIGGGTILGRMVSGFLLRALRVNQIISASYIVQGIGTIAFILSGNIWLVYASALVFGIGYGGYIPPFPLIVKDSFGMKSYGLIYGFILSGLGIGGLIGPPILGGYSFAATGNYLVTFVGSFIFSMIAGGIAILIKPSEGLGRPPVAAS